jgi:hypothetical protein
MVAAFAAAFMSTIGTQLNWGASYLVNDFYRRFLRPDESERRYVAASQWATVLLTILSAVVTFYMDSITGAWQLLIGIGAGTGAVLILRWFWWRINAWSEVAAMCSALLVSTAVRFHYGLANDDPLVFAKSTLITVGVTTVVWLAATFATAPEPSGKLISFYRRVRPSAALWGPIARQCPDVPPSRDIGWNFLDWVCGCVLIYSSLFGIGKIILKETGLGLAFLPLRDRGWGDLLGSFAARVEHSPRVTAIPYNDRATETSQNGLVFGAMFCD